MRQLPWRHPRRGASSSKTAAPGSCSSVIRSCVVASGVAPSRGLVRPTKTHRTSRCGSRVLADHLRCDATDSTRRRAIGRKDRDRLEQRSHAGSIRRVDAATRERPSAASGSRRPTMSRPMTDVADEPPRAHARIVYLGPVSPHWEVYGDYGDRTVLDEFRARVLARLVLLPRDDPQFRRNRERDRPRRRARADLASSGTSASRRRTDRAHAVGVPSHGRRQSMSAHYGRPVHQPRAELARVQRARARARRRAGDPAARAGQVLRDHLVEPRRVLPGPRRRAEGPGRGRHRPSRRRTGARRPSSWPTIAERSRALVDRQEAVFLDELRARRWPRRASRSSAGTTSTPTTASAIDRGLRAADLPGAHAAGRRSAHPFPYISNLALSLGGDGRRPRHRRATLRPGQGADRLPAAVRGRRRAASSRSSS